MQNGKHKIHCPIEGQKRREEMLEMRNQGNTYVVIAAKYGCSVSTVKSIIDRFKNKIERLNKWKK